MHFTPKISENETKNIVPGPLTGGGQAGELLGAPRQGGPHEGTPFSFKIKENRRKTFFCSSAQQV